MRDSISIEKRSEERTFVTETMFYSSPLAAYEEIKYWGKALNESHSGLCIYSSIPFEIGTTLTIHSQHLPANSRDAQIRWSKNINEELYMIGLSLL